MHFLLLVGLFSFPFFAWIINHTSMHVPIMIPININALRALKKELSIDEFIKFVTMIYITHMNTLSLLSRTISWSFI